MTDRFDNLPLADMLARDAELDAEARAVRNAIQARLIAESPVKIDRVYTVGDPEGSVWPNVARYTGRRIWVNALVPCRRQWGDRAPEWYLNASGSLLRPRPDPRGCGRLGGRYTSDSVQVSASRLDLSTESDP